ERAPLGRGLRGEQRRERDRLAAGARLARDRRVARRIFRELEEEAVAAVGALDLAEREDRARREAGRGREPGPVADPRPEPRERRLGRGVARGGDRDEEPIAPVDVGASERLAGDGEDPLPVLPRARGDEVLEPVAERRERGRERERELVAPDARERSQRR